jgi:hypothetical protein
MKYIIEKIYHYSGFLNSWSWQKLYGNRETGIGYDKNYKSEKRKDNNTMKCFYCETEVTPFETKAEVKADNVHDAVTMFDCPKCKAWYEVYRSKENLTDEVNHDLHSLI